MFVIHYSEFDRPKWGLMRLIGRLLGWIAIGAALAVLAIDGWTWMTVGGFRLMAAGEVWFRLDPASLNLSQAVVQRYVANWLWDPVVTSVLLAPAAAVFGALGLVFLGLFRSPSNRRRTSQQNLFPRD
jgi:hypothetical protein